MLNTKKWVSYAALLECPENLGVKNPHELKAAYHPSTDSLEILNSSSLESRDKKILKEILCQEEAFGYYPIGEFRGRIYLTTDMVSPSSRIFDRMDFPKYMAEVLRIYAQCHGNTHLRAIGCEWLETNINLMEAMPTHLKKLPTAFWTSIKFSYREVHLGNFNNEFGYKAVISGKLHNLPFSNDTGWRLSFRPLIALSRDILISMQDIEDGSPLNFKLPSLPL
ncbi:MAG: hypothetical protein HFJ51_01920 [Clostridia bacterium]|nr:hypothetical protein [Clostridia bacterium]